MDRVMAEETNSNQERQHEDDRGYREEIEAASHQDTQRIGDVFREMSEHGESAEGIKDALGLATVGSVHSCLGAIDTLLKSSRLTSAPTLALQRARMLRNFARRHEQLSAETRDRLRDLATEHQGVAEDERALADEAERIESKSAFGSGTLGIYVYTLPHHMRFPVIDADSDESNPRTYLKVGMSRVDAKGRIQQQVTTALPEPPLVLRRYVLREANKVDYGLVEDRMHRHLNAADHNQNRRRGAGKEWFLTHLTFIDSTAELLDLAIDYEDEDHPSSLRFEKVGR